MRLIAKDIEKRRQELLNRPPLPPRYTEEEYARFKELCANREIPKHIKDKILAHIKNILYLYPRIEEIYIIGSYARGDWADENTSPELLELRKKIKGKTKLSDIDLLVTPHINYKQDGIDVMCADIPQKIKIYENGIILL